MSSSDHDMDTPHFYDPHAPRRLQIDEQIIFLQRQIQTLKSTRNALLPISSLPDEILAAIFLIYRNPGMMKRLLSFTWVCHRWRDVGLSNASLWAFVNYDNQRWVDKCLIRSKESLFDVILRIEDEPSMKACTQALSNLYRCRSLTLSTGFVRRMREEIQEMLNRPAPMLQSLSFEDLYLPNPPLFSGHAPLLRSVTLHSCRIPSWTAGILPFACLRILKLYSNGDHDIPVNTLIQSFPSSLPNLEELFLHTILVPSPPLLPDSDSRHHVRVDFPRLRKLGIGNIKGITAVNQFLDQCHFPLSTEVTVNFDMQKAFGPSETVSDLCHLFQGSEHLKHSTFVSAQICQANQDYNMLDIKARLGSSSEEEEEEEGESYVDYGFCVNIWHGLTLQQITSTLTLLASNLKSLTITNRINNISVDDWVHVLSGLVNLEELVLEKEFAVFSFIDFIVSSTPHGMGITFTTEDVNSDSDTSFPFKALKHLKLRDFELPFPSDDTNSEVHIKFRAFWCALGIRRRCGFGLDKLWIPEAVPYDESLGDIVVLEKVDFWSD